MRIPALSAVALSILGLAGIAHAQQGGALFFEGDMVRGDQVGAPGPFCVLNNQFKRLEKVVWRIRVLDHTGKVLDDKGLKSVAVELKSEASALISAESMPASTRPRRPTGRRLDTRIGNAPC